MARTGRDIDCDGCGRSPAEVGPLQLKLITGRVPGQVVHQREVPPDVPDHMALIFEQQASAPEELPRRLPGIIDLCTECAAAHVTLSDELTAKLVGWRREGCTRKRAE